MSVYEPVDRPYSDQIISPVLSEPAGVPATWLCPSEVSNLLALNDGTGQVTITDMTNGLTYFLPAGVGRSVEISVSGGPLLQAVSPALLNITFIEA